MMMDVFNLLAARVNYWNNYLFCCRGGSGYGGHTDNYGYAPSPPAVS